MDAAAVRASLVVALAHDAAREGKGRESRGVRDDDQRTDNGRHVHGHVVGADGDNHEHAEQGNDGDGCFPLVQRLLLGLGKLGDVPGVGDELGADEGKVQSAEDEHADAEGSDAEEAEALETLFRHNLIGGGVGTHAHQRDEAAELSAEEQRQQGLGGAYAGGHAHGGDQRSHGGHHADVAAHGAEQAGDDQSGQNDVALALAGDLDHLLADDVCDARVEERGADHHHAAQQDDGGAVVSGEDVVDADDSGIGVGDGCADGGDDDGPRLPDEQDDSGDQNHQCDSHLHVFLSLSFCILFETILRGIVFTTL